MIHQIDSKNEWLLLPASFTAKFGLVFVLTLENAFSSRFHFKATRKSIDSSKKGTRYFRNSLPFERSACFYVTICENVENRSFQYKTAIQEANIKTNRIVTTKWTYHKERSFASNYYIFLKILFQFKNLLQRVDLLYQQPKYPYL